MEWFFKCESLIDVDATYLNTTEVTDMRSMFWGCKKLSTLNLKTLQTPKVKFMSYMFYECSALEAIDLSEFDTRKVEGMDYMFCDCSALETLNLSNFHVSQVQALNCMFKNCTSLKTVNLMNFQPTNTTEMISMFQGCQELTTIICPNTWTSEYATYNMFRDCPALIGAVPFNSKKTNVSMANPTDGYFLPAPIEPYAVLDETGTITFYCDSHRETRSGSVYSMPNTKVFPAWVTEGTIKRAVFDPSFAKYCPVSINGWFADCQLLKEVMGLENLNTSRTMFMEHLFFGCKSLQTLDLSSFHTPELSCTSSMFEQCAALESVLLSNFNTENVVNMDKMFAGCTALKELDLSVFRTDKVMNMEQMFRGCQALQFIICPNTWTCTESSDNMFQSCVNLQGTSAYDASQVNVSKATPTDGYFFATTEAANLMPVAYAVLSIDGKTLTFYYDCNRNARQGTKYVVPTGSDIPAWAGTGEAPNTTVRKIVFHPSFADYRPTSTRGWFQFYEALEETSGMGNLNTSETRDMSRMFMMCQAAPYIDFVWQETDQVVTMRDMFYGCKSLLSLSLSSFNTEQVEDMSGMFQGCESLDELNISNFSTQGVRDMYRMFYGCKALERLDLSGFETTLVEKMEDMFSGCSALVTIICPNLWTCMGSSGNMFQGCTALEGSVPFNPDNTDVNMATPTGGYFRASAPIVAYAVVSTDGKTLTFCYDEYRSQCTGKVYDIPETATTIPAWAGNEAEPKENIEQVVFTSAFADYRPKSTMGWFHYFTDLNNIKGIAYLNTSEVTSMNGMFEGCASMQTLDLTTFQTAKVTDMRDMLH